MTVAFSSYLTGVLPHVPGCPRNVAVDAVRKATQRLCMDALVWKEELAAINSTVGADSYTLTPVTANTEITAITYAEYDESPIDIKSKKDLDEFDLNWRNADNGTPSACYLASSTQVTLNRKADTAIAGGIVIEVALMPDDASTGAQDDIYLYYKETIEHGALHYLFQIPKKEWSDLDLAVYHGKHFNYFIQNAKAVADRNRGRKANRAKYKFFA